MLVLALFHEPLNTLAYSFYLILKKFILSVLNLNLPERSIKRISQIQFQKFWNTKKYFRNTQNMSKNALKKYPKNIEILSVNHWNSFQMKF